MSVPSSSSPFLAASSFEVAEGDGAAPNRTTAFESPFLRSYLREGQTAPDDPEAAEYLAFLAELHDPELDDALLKLAGEAAGEYAETVSGATGSVYGDPGAVRHLVDDRYAPLVRELETAVDALADATDGRALHALDEAEVDALFEAFASPDGAVEPGTPSFEFLFGIGKALKSVAKKAVGLAKKGLKAVAKMALGPLLRRLKPIAVALLKKALAAGLKWLPPELRPYAERLARRLPLLRETEAAEEPYAVDATGDVRELQAEFDVRVADTVFADSEPEMEQEAAAYARDVDRAIAGPDPVEELARAREEFVARLAEAEDGADVTPHLEAFLPAMMPVLRPALKVTGGRSALAKTLSGFLAPLIQRFVGKAAAAALSRALVEAGLRLIQLEATPEDEQRAAGAAVASVVEDTVRNVAGLPEHVLADESLLEGFVLEAFERAAARSLPHVLSEETYLERPDLRQDLTLRGAWLPMPPRGRTRYRKHTRTPWISVSPYHAAHLRTFRGLPLADVLHTRLGLPPGATLRARVHLYEAVPGTSLGDIVRGESEVPGRVLAAPAGPGRPGAGRPAVRGPALPVQGALQRGHLRQHRQRTRLVHALRHRDEGRPGGANRPRGRRERRPVREGTEVPARRPRVRPPPTGRLRPLRRHQGP